MEMKVCIRTLSANCLLHKGKFDSQKPMFINPHYTQSLAVSSVSLCMHACLCLIVSAHVCSTVCVYVCVCVFLPVCVRLYHTKHVNILCMDVLYSYVVSEIKFHQIRIGVSGIHW